MTTRRRGSSPITAAARSRKSSSTLPAAANGGRRRNDGALRSRAQLLAAPRRRNDAALLVPVALIVAASGRTGLLAYGADDHLGFHPILRDAEGRVLRPRRRHADRRGAALGHPVPRPARLLDLVPRGDVVAQHR